MKNFILGVCLGMPVAIIICTVGQQSTAITTAVANDGGRYEVVNHHRRVVLDLVDRENGVHRQAVVLDGRLRFVEDR